MREMGYSIAIPTSADIPRITVPVLNELPSEPECVIAPEELQKREIPEAGSVVEDVGNQSDAALRERINALRQNPHYTSLVTRIRTILEADNKQRQ